jgi:regulator of sigma E protease
MIISIIAVVITFGLVVFIHELGHFIACKLVGIRVEAFAFGFGKELKGFTKGDTRYSINLIPLGGYVKPAGEDITKKNPKDYEYFAKPWYSRLLVAVSGPTMNYVLAFIVFSLLVLYTGVPLPSDKPVIGEVITDYPAMQAGMQAGDTIVSVGNTKVTSWEDLSKAIHAVPGKKIKVKYQREDKTFLATLVPVKDTETSNGLIGISPSLEYKRVGLISSVIMGANQCYYWTAYTIKTLATKIYHREKPDVAGPIGIVRIIGKVIHTGFVNAIHLLGLLSVAVGLFNLFPIPLLDGGHIVLYLWEGISRKKLNEKMLYVSNSIGFAVLIFIFLFATYNDISRIIRSSKNKPTVVEQTANETKKDANR